MDLKINRRKFIQASSALVASLSFGSIGTTGAISSEKTTDNLFIKGKATQNWCEMCFWGCGLTAYSENDRVLRLSGQEGCLFNYGSLCARGNAGIEQLYNPDRLKYPLIRTGERGEGKFRKATWDEVLGIVAEKLQKSIDEYGAKSLALICHGAGQGAYTQLMQLLGAGNIAVPSYSQCLGSREISWFLTYGMPLSSKECTDGGNSKCMMFVGRNILESLQVGETKRVVDGMAKGAKIIAVDPRYSKTAAKADYWLKIKAGTDMALILGMISYILEKDLYNKPYVDKYCKGLSELKAAMQPYSIEWAAEETGLDAKLIEECTLELIKAMPRCFVHPGKRISRYGNDTQYSRSVAILNALLGTWGVKGGFFSLNGFKGLKSSKMFDYALLDEDEFERADGAGDKYPLSPTNLGLTNGTLEAIRTQQPYPIKSLIVMGGNIFQNSCNKNDLIVETIKQLDLLITSDIFMTETALYSDIILPEPTYLERQDPISVNSNRKGIAQYREAAVSKMYDTMGAWETCGIIAQKMGYKGKVKTIDEMNEALVSQLGIRVDYFKENGYYINPAEQNDYKLEGLPDFEFPTESGKIELYSQTLKELGFDPTPQYEKHPEPRQDELRLVFGRQSQHTHARTQNNRWLLATQDYEIFAWIPKGYADKKGIKTNDEVVVVDEFKKSKVMKAYVTDRITEGLLYIPHGYGRFSKEMTAAYAMKGASDADFCSNGIDPISGAAAFHLSFVKVDKARA